MVGLGLVGTVVGSVVVGEWQVSVRTGVVRSGVGLQLMLVVGARLAPVTPLRLSTPAVTLRVRRAVVGTLAVTVAPGMSRGVTFGGLGRQILIVLSFLLLGRTEGRGTPTPTRPPLPRLALVAPVVVGPSFIGRVTSLGTTPGRSTPGRPGPPRGVPARRRPPCLGGRPRRPPRPP